MNKLRLVLVFLLALISWQSWVVPTAADGPNAALLEQTNPQQLVIPTISLNTSLVPVGLGTTMVNGQEYPIWNTAENNVGWHQGSGPPGQIGNTVLAGHSSGGSEIFRHLGELEVGEDIFVRTNQGWYQYRVAEKLILKEQGEPVEVRAANARWILPSEDERLTLITCWPYPARTHRLLLIAYPISHDPPPTSITLSEPDLSIPTPNITPKQISRQHSHPSTTKLQPAIAHLADVQLQKFARVYALNSTTN
jgi:LPXTG-site transpeptidase (sortase) family protein